MFQAPMVPGGDDARALFYEDVTSHIRTAIEQNKMDADRAELKVTFSRSSNHLTTRSNMGIVAEGYVVNKLRTEFKSYYPEVTEAEFIYEKGALSIIKFETR